MRFYKQVVETMSSKLCKERRKRVHTVCGGNYAKLSDGWDKCALLDAIANAYRVGISNI